MTSKLFRSLAGALLGLSISLLIFALVVEHIQLFLLTPIAPAFGVLIGGCLGFIKKVPLPKLWLSVALSLGIILGVIVYDEIRDSYFKSQRIEMAKSIATLHPGSTVTEVNYEEGNGWDTPPNISVQVISNSSFTDVMNFMRRDENLQQWRGDWGQVSFHEKENSNADSSYQIKIDFYTSFYGT